MARKRNLPERVCRILQFKPKKAKGGKSLRPIKKHMGRGPGSGGRRLSREIYLAPKKTGNCAFKSSCKRRCKKGKEMGYTDHTRNLLRREADYNLMLVNNRDVLEGMEIVEEKLTFARELGFVLEGSVLPHEYEHNKGTYSLCGGPPPGEEGVQTIENFTAAQMREAISSMNLNEVDLNGAYISYGDAPAAGLHPDFARLFCRIANLTLPKSTTAITTLMMEGGRPGLEQMSIMIGEPTTPHQARMEYIASLSKIISCASFDSENVMLENAFLARALPRALSRFYPLGYGKISDGTDISLHMIGSEAPPKGKVNMYRLKQMIAVGIEEFFQAIVDMSARIAEISSASRRTREGNKDSLSSLKTGLKEALRFITGEAMGNKKLLEEFCVRKKAEILGEEMDAKEQAAVRLAARQLWGEDAEISAESVDLLLYVLDAEGETVDPVREKLLG